MCGGLALAVLLQPGLRDVAAQSSRPNIVLIFPDNLGWGEVGAYGSVRGNLTPRIDKLASEGIRLNNFNVEFSCVVSRAALMTGRYAVRTGATQPSGITLWEVTLAEALKSVGYATGLFGKWHLGGDRPDGRREPTHQGFDEFYGIPRTSNEAKTTIAQGQTTRGTSFVWEGRTGTPTQERQGVRHGGAADDRSRIRRARHRLHGARGPRSAAVLHVLPDDAGALPRAASSGLRGQDRAGDIGDAMAEVDHNVGLVLDALDRLKIASNTIVFWCADNGAEQRRPWRGSSGPWSGFYNTVMEGGIRTPCIIRWPGRIRAGQVTDEIIHQVDFFPTLAAAAGADIVPKDRAIDGVNQLPFLEGKQPKSNRDHALFFANHQLRAVKWHEWKLHYAYLPEAGVAPVPPLMRLFNLLSDPEGRNRHQGRSPMGPGCDRQDRRGVYRNHGALPARPAGRSRSVRAAKVKTDRAISSSDTPFASWWPCRRAPRRG